MCFILRNSDGHFIATKEQVWHGNYQPKEAEAICMRKALKWLKEMKIDYVHIESYALLVIQRLTNYNLVSSFDLVIEDTCKLANEFQSISFSFVKRSTNTAVHLLAREVVFADYIVGLLWPLLFCMMLSLWRLLLK